MGDNGQGERADAPSPEELMTAKKKLFDEKPEEFFHFSEFVIAVRKVSNGLQTMIGGSTRTELEAAVVRAQYEVFRFFDALEVAKAQEKSKLVKPGGIMNFVRRR